MQYIIKHPETIAQQQILKMVLEISQVHPSGPEFFDAMDKEIMDSGTKEMYDELFKLLPTDSMLILSGGFGRKIAAMIDNRQLPEFSYCLFQGGIRSGGECNEERVFHNKGINMFECEFVFLDDSIYGGKTFYVLQKYLKEKYGVDMKWGLVIYDGYPQKKEYIKSLFRYYDYFDAKPNFDLPENPQEFFTSKQN